MTQMLRAILLPLAALLGAAAAHAGSIRLDASAVVDGSAVTLGQVAELEGELASELADVEIARFRSGQRELTLSLAEVRQMLTQDHEVNWGLVSLSGYSQCDVRRQIEADEAPAAQPVETPAEAEPVAASPQMTLRGLVTGLIERRTGLTADELRIELSDRDAERLGRSALEGRWELETSSTSGLGRVPVTLRQYVAGQVADRLAVTVDVERQARVLVATQRVARGERIDAEDIALRTVWLGDDRAEPLAKVDLVAGQEAAATISKGDVLYPSDVCEPEMIGRGELVTVRCVSGRLVVRTVGRAQEDGVMGQVIRIRNESNRETYHASVTGRREAVMELGSMAQGGER
ncbi:MAG: flagellar basal body P-ring formation chaperone FlgA [Phycisphaeraceae bacterium]